MTKGCHFSSYISLSTMKIVLLLQLLHHAENANQFYHNISIHYTLTISRTGVKGVIKCMESVES